MIDTTIPVAAISFIVGGLTATIVCIRTLVEQHGAIAKLRDKNEVLIGSNNYLHENLSVATNQLALIRKQRSEAAAPVAAKLRSELA